MSMSAARGVLPNRAPDRGANQTIPATAHAISTAAAASHRQGTVARHLTWRPDVDRDVRLNGLERGTHFPGALIAVRRVLRQASLNHAAKHRGHVRRQGLRRASAGSRRQLEFVPAFERQLAGRHLEQRHAQRPDVAALVAGLAEQHLRRHVRQRSGEAGRRDCIARACDGIGEAWGTRRARPKSRTLARPFVVDHDVRRLQVAMDDAVLSARVRERRRSGRHSATTASSGRPSAGMSSESGRPSTYSIAM